MSESSLIVEAHAPSMIGEVRSLLGEYAAVLGKDLCFRQFDAELANLPGEYAPPAGRIYLASVNNETAGCVALRPMSPDAAEIKRLYVRPLFRGKGIGEALVTRAIVEARVFGYRSVFLDTLPSMKSAIALYRSLGFVDIAPYGSNPVKGAICMKYEL
ncbi:MAG TPA: GNAT family N-acetyltransferase [Thermoanaerobaculia bacterium]|nr:GNAT family N-acetyltransferase [Thermoanaerobaculia bacterium]